MKTNERNRTAVVYPGSTVDRILRSLVLDGPAEGSGTLRRRLRLPGNNAFLTAVHRLVWAGHIEADGVGGQGNEWTNLRAAEHVKICPCCDRLDLRRDPS